MSSHLSISVELIAFMKWLLEHKRPALNSFLASVLDKDIRAELIHIMHEPEQFSGEQLYDIVNTFLGHIEEEVMSSVEQEAAQGPPASKDESTAWYKSLSKQTQAQLNQAFDNRALHTGALQAANMLEQNATSKKQSEQVKKNALLHNLLENWLPMNDEEVN